MALRARELRARELRQAKSASRFDERAVAAEGQALTVREALLLGASAKPEAVD